MRQTTAPQGPPGGSEAARTACAVRTAARRACGRAARGGRSGHALRMHVPPTDLHAGRPCRAACNGVAAERPRLPGGARGLRPQAAGGAGPIKALRQVKRALCPDARQQGVSCGI